VLVATIKDVARLAGVGLGTASRVVSGRGSVATATAERVRQAIETLEFRPSHAARSLLTGSTQMIGVYLPMLKGTFYTPILQVIDTELRANGQHMMVAFGSGVGNARRQAIEGIEFLLARGCDGLMVMSKALHEQDIAALGPKQSKVVLLNQYYRSIRDQCFPADHKQGGRLAAKTLLDLNHRKLAIIAGPSTAPDNVARIAGFMTEVERCGIDPTKVPQVESDFSPEGGYQSTAKLMVTKRAFTGLFCANDEMAVGALAYFQENGIAVPGKISVLGYDDTQTAEYSSPRLTSIHIPWRDITMNGLYWLLNRCYDSNRPVERKFAVSVSLRASVGPLPRK
jgi:LacI family transcriptional regulator